MDLERISQLRDEARKAGDTRVFDVCEAILDRTSTPLDRAIVAETLRDAAARDDEKPLTLVPSEVRLTMPFGARDGLLMTFGSHDLTVEAAIDIEVGTSSARMSVDIEVDVEDHIDDILDHVENMVFEVRVDDILDQIVASFVEEAPASSAADLSGLREAFDAMVAQSFDRLKS